MVAFPSFQPWGGWISYPLTGFVAMLNETLTSADVPAILADVYLTQVTLTMDVFSQLLDNLSNKKLHQIEHPMRQALPNLRMLF